MNHWIKPLLNLITNDITIRNNADLKMKSVYLYVYSRFSLMCLLFINIHEYANGVICMYDHWKQGNVIPYQNGYNNVQQCGIWDEISSFMGLVYDFPSCSKDFITIHEYANNIICITYHVISGVCQGFNLVPSLVV